MRLFHQCWIEFLDKWKGKTKDAQVLPWADGVSRMSSFFVAGPLGDQQEGDKYIAEPCTRHHCEAPRNSYLRTDHSPSKPMKIIRNKVQLAPEGEFLPGTNKTAKWIVRWDPDGRNLRSGPGNSFYFINYDGLQCYNYNRLK